MRRVQRIAAYNVCVDDQQRLLMCRLSTITERPGWWTLPGGGVEFGEHPEDTARRELLEETGLVGHVAELLTVDSLHRPARDGNGDLDYHSVRLVYRTDVDGGDLKHEADGSTDLAAWCTREELAGLSLVDMGKLGVRLAFGTP
ncbi:MAG TPA: NUDIX domain-containing protein [Acidimicrobiia bacterium]|nr:NUDIX domain-containing protein [Acidimicrobiia bacterium]